MAIEVKTWGIKEILEVVERQAKAGSCKTCRWCSPVSGFRNMGGATRTHQCLIQGNVNPIFFSQQTLDAEAYPHSCEEGKFQDGGFEPIYECLAYQPQPEIIPFAEAELAKVADQHRQFMSDLNDAANLSYQIRHDWPTKLLQKLNASESLPKMD